jgi:hypothetical protein
MHHESRHGCQQSITHVGPAMATLIAVAAFGSLLAGAIAAGIGMVSVAIHHEEKNRTLIRDVPGQLTGAARRLNGVYVRAPGQPAGAARRRT